MSLRTRVGVMALIGVIALAVAGFLVGSRFFEARSAAEDVVTNLQPAADAADSLLVAIAEMDRGLLQFVGTGKAASLGPFSEGVTQSQRNIATLQFELANTDEALQVLVNNVQSARNIWLDGTARPVIAAVRADNSARAHDIIQSDTSVQTYALMQAEAAFLQDSIDDRRSQVFGELTDFTRQLASMLVITGVALLGLLVLAIVMLHQWVLRPLDELRLQLKRVASEGLHESPIIPSGPEELRKAGQDAEEMRRQLVTEIDAARAAREGLEQDAPVVAAIRAELSRPQVGYAPGLEIFGDLQPAEGVLAGDWWDMLTLPDGRTAIMVTDVSGHGPKAGIAGLRAKLTLTSVLETGGSAAEAMLRGAQLFAQSPARFATCVIVVLDPAHRTVEWVNAGHLPPIVLNSSGEHRDLELTGPLLSALGGSWVSRQAPMADDDVLAIWTDGVTESRNASGEQLEDSGLIEMLVSARELGAITPKQLVPAVLARARNRAIDWRRDDVTMIAARFNGRADQPGENDQVVVPATSKAP